MPDNDPNTLPPNPAESYQRLLEQHKNDANAVALKLFGENYDLRTRNRELMEKQPKDGGVVLSADDAKEWNAFKALNVKASDAKKQIEAAATLEKQNKELAAMENLREIADLGLDGSKLKISVLKDQLSGKYPDAAITFKTEKDKDGKEAKVAYIQKTDKDAVQPFAEFANSELTDYLPSLKVTPEANTPVPPGNTGDPKPQNAASSLFDRIREDVTKKSEATKPADIDARFGRAAVV
jgi:hypothetical protein